MADSQDAEAEKILEQVEQMLRSLE